MPQYHTGRYPFADSEKVVSLSDFERFFGAGGTVDSYFKKNLKAKSTLPPRLGVIKAAQAVMVWNFLNRRR